MSRPPEYKEKEEVIIGLLKKKLSVRDIANKTGISKSTIGRIKKQLDQGTDT